MYTISLERRLKRAFEAKRKRRIEKMKREGRL
jgi:hypothetical protein